MKSKSIPTLAPPLRPRRKLRGDARLAHLSPAQRDRLHAWLDRENRPYVAVVQLVRSEFDVTTSKSALAVYYRRFILPEHTDEHPDDTETAACLAALKAGHTNPYTLYRAHALAYSALARPDPQIATATKLLDHLHRIEKKALARQRLALKHERAALRQQELAARHPLPFSTLNPQLSTSPAARAQDPSPHPLAPNPPPSSQKIPPASPRFPAYSELVTPSTPASPTPEFPASVTSVPPPCAPCPNLRNPTPLQPPPTPSSSFPSFSSVQPPPSPNSDLRSLPSISSLFPLHSVHHRFRPKPETPSTRSLSRTLSARQPLNTHHRPLITASNR